MGVREIGYNLGTPLALPSMDLRIRAFLWQIVLSEEYERSFTDEVFEKQDHLKSLYSFYYC